ncbi:hypothetical protein GLOIN_2v1488640 [Rhizophagus clarus]|uniref:Myb/SANT-like DNA-binding domain-containing protein n=1 Tax=Rhizophagus clarus TaxID=94130 RepID=A0A8H3MCM1_9GLOM|nr:hypothetical protein GLOIN_2v1488640 [Rhizophagus clarus]
MSSRNSSILWDKAETDLLVEERRKRNHEYHYVHRGNKGRFWESVSRRIHRRLCRRYSARQCEIKFRNLIKEKCVNGVVAQEEAEERHITEPSISTFSEPNSGKSLVIIKNDLID